MASTLLILFLLFSCFFAFCWGQAARDNGEGGDQLAPVEPGDPEFRERRRGNCSVEYRTYDGSCTNIEYKIWGSASTPLYSYLHRHSSKTPTGASLPSPRYISNVLCAQSNNIFNRRGLSEFVVFFGQFLDHTFVATASNRSEPMHIPIPRDDPIFANFSSGYLPFHRNVRGLTMHEGDAERPINTLSSAIDLASVYSSDDERIKSLREFRDGLLRMSSKGMLPVNDMGLVNAPTKDAKFYLAGDHRANEHPVLTSLHTLFVREHNLLCRELKKTFPHWGDRHIFEMARKINGAQFQKIVFEEWFPQLTGRRLKPYRGFNKNINPSLSDIFTTAAYRVGHTMVGNSISQRGEKMSEMPDLQMHEMFFRPVDVMNGGIEPFIRGAIHRRAQEVDTQVSSSIRNFLFTGIPQEEGFDLIALNIQRGRDHALPTYNQIRIMFGRPPARRFRQITRNLALANKLHTVYRTPDRVEAWVGLMAEDHVGRASMGRTMLRIWEREFMRMRDGDWFHYKRWSLFPREVWGKFYRLREMMFERETMKSIILRNTKITREELRGSIWRGSR